MNVSFDEDDTFTFNGKTYTRSQNPVIFWIGVSSTFAAILLLGIIISYALLTLVQAVHQNVIVFALTALMVLVLVIPGIGYIKYKLTGSGYPFAKVATENGTTKVYFPPNRD